MSRFLVVVPPFTGHINPVAGVAAELRSRGHEVAWAGDETALSRCLPGDWPVHDCPATSLAPRPPHLSGYGALKHLWERVLVPLADEMAPGVREAVDRVRPDVVVADQQALAGALVAVRAGIVWATSATTSAELADPLAATTQVRAWLSGLLAGLRQRHGVPEAGDPRFSPHLVLAFTTPDLAGPVAAPVRFVGPVRRASDGEDFPWDRLDPARAAVLVTLGTANTEVTGDFLRSCAAALCERPGVQGVIADPGNDLRDLGGEHLRLPWLPLPALLPRAAAVICHAGHNTVCEALACGVPLVVAPIRDDQPIIAEQVTKAGAGVRLRFTHSRAEHIGRALDRILTEPSFTAEAARIRDSFTAAGGPVAAADALEDLAARQGTRENRA